MVAHTTMQFVAALAWEFMEAFQCLGLVGLESRGDRGARVLYNMSEILKLPRGERERESAGES